MYFKKIVYLNAILRLTQNVWGLKGFLFLHLKHNFRPGESVWIAISIIEEAWALKLQWQESTVRNEFLDSLNIDANRVKFFYCFF